MRPSLWRLPFSSRALTLIAVVALIGVGLLGNLVALPLITLPILYVFPILIATLVLRPADVRLVAILAFLAECIDFFASNDPIVVIIGDAFTLGIIGFLAYILAKKREEADALARAATASAQAADASRQSLQQFLGMVAHDLRAPLTVLYGNAQRLQVPRGGRELSERDHQTVERIIGSAQRLRRLVDDLVDASRIGAGRFEIEVTSFDFIALVRTVIEEQQAVSAVHQITLDAPHELIVRGDRERIAQVLTNLVTNAVKYSAGGAVRVTVHEAGQDVICCVADQGIGLTAEQVGMLCQPFVRFDHTQTGVGLGLFISRGIVEAHHGRLWAESEPGRGSTFCFALPIRSS